MNVFTSRIELLSFVQRHIVFKYIKRAMQEGSVENYGAFSKAAEGHNEPGWILKITSAKRVVYFISVVCEENYRLYKTVEGPDWKNWAGGDCENELYRGDHPELYMKLRDERLKDA